MSVGRVAPVILTLWALCACASGGGSAAAAAPTDAVGTAAFAARVAVDLAAMRATSRGTYLRDLRVGTGSTLSREMTASVRFTGWLADGTRIDSTAASEAPITFRVGRGEAIAGWDDGLPGMRVGGRRQLVVPPRLGYGAKGQGPIPPNAVLVFVVELVAAR